MAVSTKQRTQEAVKHSQSHQKPCLTSSPRSRITTRGQGMMTTSREAVIVAVDANRSKGSVEAVEWALRHLVRPGDILLVLGVLHDEHLGNPKKHSCFPFKLLKGTGTCERSEMIDYEEVVLEEKYERKRGEYQISLQTIASQCKNNGVKLELKFGAGYCPARLAIDEAQNLNTRWIVLDSHFRKSKVYLRGHVSCSIAVMKGKDFATVMLSIATPPDIFRDENYDSSPTDHPGEVHSICLSPNQLRNSCAPPPYPQNPCCYPLSWRTGFPRVFSHKELEVMTNGFADDNITREKDGTKVYQGILQDTTILVKSFRETNKGFWIMLKILSLLSHRNIMNLTGYCYTGSSAYLVVDFPCLGDVETNLQCDELAQKLGWKARWSIAIEIGGSLRYLHEECAGEPIVHKSVCSFSVALSHDYSAMLGIFDTAEWLAGDFPPNDDLIAGCSNLEEDERLFVDVRGYGKFLLELITGKSASCFHNEGKDQSMIDWALPLLENGVLKELMDCRVSKTAGDARMVRQMAHAALLCLNVDSDHKLSISQALAIVRGDELVVPIQALKIFE